MIQKTPKQNKLICINCSLCCEHVSICIDPPNSPKDEDTIRWYLYHNFHVYITDEDLWYVEIEMKCKHLNSRGECDIYENRPQICRDYSQSSCEKYGVGTDIKYSFSDYEGFSNYLKIIKE